VANIIEITLKGIDKTSGVFKKTEKSVSSLNTALSKYAKLAGAVVIAGTGALIISSTKLAARVETLGVVTKKMGETVGWSEEKIRALEQSLIDTGITLQSSRQSIAMMIQANVDLERSTDLARLAQNAAVIANINSSDAFRNLIYVIQTGNVRMARTMGLQVSFRAALEETAKQLDKTTEELTEEEIMLARTNAVMKAGTRITGVYEAAMETAGKQLLSLDRYVEEFKVSLGTLFIPVLAEAVEGLTWFFKTMREGLDTANLLLNWHEMIGEAMMDNADTYEEYIAGAIKSGKATLLFGQLIGELSEEAWELEEIIRGVNIATAEQITKQKELGGVIGDTTSDIEDLTEAQWLQMAAEAMIAGDYAAAQHFADMAYEVEQNRDRIQELIQALDDLDGKSVYYTLFGAEVTGVGGVGGPPTPTTEIPSRGFPSWAAGIAAGFEHVGGEWVRAPGRQYGGPVSAGMPYLVGERGPETFVPTQAGRIERTDNSRTASVTVEQLIIQGGGQEIETQMAMEDSLLRVLEELL